jgi:PadR family transcriptional regulator PadR
VLLCYAKYQKEGLFLDNSQMLKGVLEGCVLSIIVKRETYGYEILTKLEEAGFQNIGDGTSYPVLTRLAKKRYILYRK